MIDPLLTAAVPPPPREKPREPQSGAPAFLPWANAQPGQGGVDHRDAGLQDPVKPDVAIENLPGALLGAMSADVMIPVVGAGTAVDAVAAADAALHNATTTATPLDALQLDPSLFVQDETTVELHLARPGGEREVVALPWRLFAQHRLAYVTDGHAQSVTSAAQATAAGAMGGGHLPGTTTSAPGFQTAAALSAAATRAALPTVLQQMQTSAGAGRIGETAGARAQATPAAMEWLARWMKWIERDGRDPVVWLRDFRLDADGIREVVEGLRTLAREQGTPLARIVVNGREQWRAASFDPAQGVAADGGREDPRRSGAGAIAIAGSTHRTGE